MERQLSIDLYNRDFKSIVTFTEKYPFYIGKVLFPLLKENKSRLNQAFVNDIFNYVQRFYPHEKLFSNTHERFYKQTATLNIHNRYH